MTERTWGRALVRTAGLRLCVLPVSAAMALVSAGMIMHFAGTAAFGFIALVSQLQLALPFADLGLGAAVARAVARRGQSDADRYASEMLLRRTALLLTMIGTCAAAVAVMLGRAGVWSDWLAVPPHLAGDLDLVMTVVLVLFFLMLPLGLAERVLVGTDRADLLVVLGLIPALCNLAVVFLVGVLDLRPMWLALGLPLGTVVFLLACSRAAGLRSLLLGTPAQGRRPGVLPTSLAQILWGGLPVVLTTAGVVLAEQHGRFLLGAAATPQITSEYALGLYLYMPVYSVLYMGATVLWPRFARGTTLRVWRQANVALLLLGAGAACAYLICARPISSVVSGAELVLSWPVTVCFSLLFVAQAAHLAQANLLTDVAGFRWQAAMALTLVAAVVPLSLLGLHRDLGAAAPAAAMTLAVLVTQVLPGVLLARRRLRPWTHRASHLQHSVRDQELPRRA